jgi:hypothetical protein
MILVDIGAVVLMAGLLGGFIAVVRSDKSKRQEEERLRSELGQALFSNDKARLQNFLVLWNDKLNKDQKDAIKARIDDMVIQENP